MKPSDLDLETLNHADMAPTLEILNEKQVPRL